MERWHKKVAVVTGASSGIGAATVKALLHNGLIVVGLARRYNRMEIELKETLEPDEKSNFYPYKCDVSVEQDILNAFNWIKQRFGGVDVLVNNAGIIRTSYICSAKDTEDMRAIIDTNIMGAALCTREAFQSMKDRDVNGHVILINSVAGHRVPNLPNFRLNMYAPSKHAMTAMTEVLRQEFKANRTKIKVTSISPGAVYTEIIPNPSGVPKDYPFLHPNDIADAIVYCLQTPPHVQIHEMTIKPIGEDF